MRVTDQAADIKLLVILHSASRNPNATESSSEYNTVLYASEAYEQRVLEIWRGHLERSDKMIKEIVLGIPNITMNVRGSILNSTELRSWAVVGILLQSLTLTMPAIATYHWKWLRKGKVVPEFAYYCFLVGSVATIAGILGCRHIIESSTTKYTFRKHTREERQIRRILRLQMKCKVGAQHFPSFAILNHAEDTLIRTSTLNNREYG